MGRRFLYIVSVGLVLSALLGWLRGRLPDVGDETIVDGWSYGETLPATTGVYDALNSRLKATGMFPKSLVRLKAIQAKNGQESVDEKKIPPFPVIVAVGIVDKIAQVHLRLEDGRIMPAKSGDVLESGWELKLVDLNKVIAVYYDEEFEFQITNYEEHEGTERPISSEIR